MKRLSITCLALCGTSLLGFTATPALADESEGTSATSGIQEIVVTAQKREESLKLARTFAKNGFDTVDLTDNELAKQHVRHMVGGHTELAHDERLYRFIFPERPGALMRFLSAMHPDWNITLFHYRNQGADYGRILVGLQVPKGDNAALRDFLDALNYPYEDETDNPVYKLFLR